MANGASAGSVDSSHDALAIEDLTVRYFGRDVDALHGVSLEVATGEFLSIAGRNGAGKSTLALACAGFIPRVVRAIVTGNVRAFGASVLDRDGGSHTEPSRQVGIVFPNPANQLSATKATVREELAFGLENLGIPRAEMDIRIDEVLGSLGIADLAERMPFALSGGEQQRVAIASIMAMGAPILVLDEPTGQLDPGGTQDVAELLGRLSGQGTTVVAIEHDPAILLRADRTMVLSTGTVAAVDLPARALGSAVLGPVGLRPPTAIALAEGLGIDPSSVTDEAALAAAIARVGTGERQAIGDLLPPLDSDLAIRAWSTVRDVAPTGIIVGALVHRYPNGVEAVRGVDLGVAAGETVAIVGRNGSGKTTLVKHLNGLLRPDQGGVEIGGRDISDRPVHEIARTVGFVFQNPDDQLFARSIEREAAFGPRNLRLGEADAARLVEQALTIVGLWDARADNPYDHSVSDRKLVALASVLAMDPAILVLDEPTTGQDGPGVARVGAIVDGLAAIGRTVIAITHDMEFAASHFGRIVVMRQGEVVADGSPQAVFAPGNDELLASTGLRPPLAARIGARLGLGSTPTEEALIAALGGTSG